MQRWLLWTDCGEKTSGQPQVKSSVLEHYWSGRTAWPMASRNRGSRPELDLRSSLRSPLQRIHHRVIIKNCNGSSDLWSTILNSDLNPFIDPALELHTFGMLKTSICKSSGINLCCCCKITELAFKGKICLLWDNNLESGFGRIDHYGFHRIGHDSYI